MRLCPHGSQRQRCHECIGNALELVNVTAWAAIFTTFLVAWLLFGVCR